MQTRPERLTFIPALLALVSCATGTPQVLEFRDERVGLCVDGRSCELAGQLTLQAEPGSYNTASIDQVHGTCVPLLVPASLHDDRDRWQGKRVRITGTALARVNTAGDIMRIKYRDRWLLDGICGNSNIVVYVDQITRER